MARLYQDEKQQVLTRTIDLQILYLEECQQKYLRVRKNVETAIEVELKKPRYRKFINLYWGSGLSKAEARKLVMQELELSQTTFTAGARPYYRSLQRINGKRKSILHQRKEAE